MAPLRKYLILSLGVLTICLNAACSQKWNTIFSDKFGEVDEQVLLMALDGDATAQTSIGLMFERGLGVDANPKEAFSWYYQAASKGNLLAAFHLGSLYERGLGIEQNYKYAAKWYLVAAKQGSEPALVALAYFYERGYGVKRDYIKAAELYATAEKLSIHKRESADILEPKPYEPKAITEYLRSTIIPDPAKDSPPKLAIGINNKTAIEVDLNAIGNLD